MLRQALSVAGLSVMLTAAPYARAEFLFPSALEVAPSEIRGAIEQRLVTSSFDAHHYSFDVGSILESSPFRWEASEPTWIMVEPDCGKTAADVSFQLGLLPSQYRLDETLNSGELLERKRKRLSNYLDPVGDDPAQYASARTQVTLSFEFAQLQSLVRHAGLGGDPLASFGDSAPEIPNATLARLDF